MTQLGSLLFLFECAFRSSTEIGFFQVVRFGGLGRPTSAPKARETVCPEVEW